MTDAPDLEPAALEASALEFERHHRDACYPEALDAESEIAAKAIVRAYLAARSAPEAGKAATKPLKWSVIDYGASLPAEAPVQERAKIDALTRLRENIASFDAEVAFQLANEGERADLWTEIDVNVEDLRVLLRAVDYNAAGREVGWLIERKYPVNSIGATEPRWYAERENGDHRWTPVPNEAKRFASRAEAEAYPSYQMIASDPAISITEHVWINDGFSWSHGRGALASVPAPTGEIAEPPLSRMIADDGRPMWEQISDLIKYHMNERPPFRLRDELVTILDWARYGEARLTASEAEAADLRRKLEEHQDAEDKAAREMATVIQGLRNRATAAERKLEEAREALELARGRLSALEGYPYPIAKDYNRDIIGYIDDIAGRQALESDNG